MTLCIYENKKKLFTPGKEHEAEADLDDEIKENTYIYHIKSPRHRTNDGSVDLSK